MADRELAQYVEKARKQGLSNEQIMKELLGVGWQVHDIVDIVLDRRAEPPKADIYEEMRLPRINDNIISVRNLSKSYGKVKALDGINLDVKKGSVTALLGPNGAGKTTLVRVLTTLLVPDSGSVQVAGLDVVREAQELRSVIGLAGQYAAVDEILTGRENLEMVARLYHLSRKEAQARATELLKQFDLEEAADRTLKTYSGGMRRRLDLAASLVIRPKILFLDEPTTGLDPRGRFGLWNVIRDLVEDGTTVLLTTQYLEEADQLAHKIFVIDRGHIIAEGTTTELKRQVGGDILELHLTTHADATKAGEILKSFGEGEPNPDIESGIVTMPVKGGAAVLIEVVRKFDVEGIKILDIQLRRPSLDDVFMKLTGHGAEENNK